MTMLRWIIAAAVGVLLIYATIGGLWLRRRHNYFLARAQEYVDAESRLRLRRERLISESKNAGPSHDQSAIWREKERSMVASELEYSTEMARKYRRAAGYPWLSVEGELPEPW